MIGVVRASGVIDDTMNEGDAARGDAAGKLKVMTRSGLRRKSVFLHRTREEVAQPLNDRPEARDRRLRLEQSLDERDRSVGGAQFLLNDRACSFAFTFALFLVGEPLRQDFRQRA